MTEESKRPRARAVSTAALAMVLAATVSFVSDHGFSLSQAEAANGNGHDSHGGGNGGNGNGGGNGGNGEAGGNGGNGVGHGAAGKQADAGHAQSAGFSDSRPSSAQAGFSDSSPSSAQLDGDASGLGSLNAAHASAQALANASPNSQVGRIDAYRRSLDRYLSDLNAGAPPGVLNDDIAAVGATLGDAANKTLTTRTVDRVNGLLGVSTASDPNWESSTAPSIVDIANEP
jgi:hypothetical protein